MVNLKSFILKEEIKSSHAAKFIDYQDNFHDDVLQDLTDKLTASWKKLAEEFNEVQPSEFRINQVKEKNPDALLGVEFDAKDVPVGVGRFNKPKMALASVKLSHAYTRESRKQMIKKLLAETKSVFEKTIGSNKKAFAIKMNSGNYQTLFHVRQSDDDTIKIQFKTLERDKKNNLYSNEVIKTIFIVGVEHGKENSKSKQFDRVFFIDYTQ